MHVLTNVSTLRSQRVREISRIMGITSSNLPAISKGTNYEVMGNSYVANRHQLSFIIMNHQLEHNISANLSGPLLQPFPLFRGPVPPLCALQTARRPSVVQHTVGLMLCHAIASFSGNGRGLTEKKEQRAEKQNTSRIGQWAMIFSTSNHGNMAVFGRHPHV